MANPWQQSPEEKCPPIFHLLSPKLSAEPVVPTSEDFLGGLGVLLRSTLTAEECKGIIEVSERVGYQPAKDYCFMYRDRWNDRFMSDDPELSQFVWERVKAYVPNRIEAFDRQWELDGLNTRFRFCKYIGGQGHYFGPHTDGVYRVDNDHTSILTCMLYLNGKEDFEGGLTNFIEYKTHKLNFSVQPEPGLCVIFRQMDLRCYHEGTEVTQGLKYILRTDIMFHAVD